MHYFSNLFDKVLYKFRTSPLSIIRSISTLYTRNRYLSCLFCWLSASVVRTRCTVSQIYLIKYSTSFEQVHCSSSRVSKHCIHAIGICQASSVGCLMTTLADSQQNKHDKYLLRVYSVEILLMMDSGPVRNL